MTPGVLALLAAAVCPSDVPVGSEELDFAWAAIRERSLDQHRQNHRKYTDQAVSEANRAAREKRATVRGGDRLPSLARANVANAIDIASAAIDTNIAGVEAGVAVSPFLLAGWDTAPHQVQVTLAAKKESRSRVALNYSYAPLKPLETYADLGLDPCDVEKQLGAYTKELDGQECAFKRVCAALAAKLPRPQGALVGDWEKVQSTCGGRPEMTLGIFGATVLGLAKDRAQAGNQRVVDALEKMRAEVERLAAVRPPVLDACHKDEIAAAALQAAWKDAKPKLGVMGAMENFAVVFGSSDPADTKGAVARWEGRVETDLNRERMNFTLGVGVASERTSPDKRLQKLFTPAADFSFVLGAIGAEPLIDEKGRVRVKDGAIAPHVVIGLSIMTEISPDVGLTSGSIAPYADFKFTKDLVVRVGIPIQPKRSCKDPADKQCDPLTSDSQRTELRWTVPASVTTILKI